MISGVLWVFAVIEKIIYAKMFVNGFEHKQVTLWHVITRANSDMFRCISAKPQTPPRQ